MENLFFSDTLQRRLEQVKIRPLSALEAPAGYGKTTAIRSLFPGLPEGRRIPTTSLWTDLGMTGASRSPHIHRRSA